MDKLTQKQIEDYKQMCFDRNNGRILTPDGLRFICEANNYDPEAIGRHFLEVLAHLLIIFNLLLSQFIHNESPFSKGFYAAVLYRRYMYS